MEPLEALASLKDIDGVYGSFVVDAGGVPTLRDLPTIISNSALTEAGPRIARLWGALPPDDPGDRALISFSSHQLFVKRLAAGSLCVFVPPGVNRLALNVAANLVKRVLDSQSAPRPTPPPMPLSRSVLASAALPSRASLAPRQAFGSAVSASAAGSGYATTRPVSPLPSPALSPSGSRDPAAADRAAPAASASKKKTIVYRGRRYEI